MNNNGSDRLKRILQKDSSGIPDSVSEVLKRDLIKLFSEYLELGNDGVKMAVDCDNSGIKIAVAVNATAVKNVRIMS